MGIENKVKTKTETRKKPYRWKIIMGLPNETMLMHPMRGNGTVGWWRFKRQQLTFREGDMHKPEDKIKSLTLASITGKENEEVFIDWIRLDGDFSEDTLREQYGQEE